MEQRIRSFFYENKEIRTIIINGEPWWVAKDVCAVLDISNHRDAVSRLENDCVGSADVIDAMNRTRQMSIVNEFGLYELIFVSRKPEAHKFRKWLTRNVLPAIRKYGVYATDAILEAAGEDIGVLHKIIVELKSEKAKNKVLEREIEQDLPKVIFANAVNASDTGIMVGELAKLICQNGCEIGQNRLFEWLRKAGYLMKSGARRNLPTQRAMNRGLFKIKETAIICSDGGISLSLTPKVTGKGQIYFVNAFCGYAPEGVRAQKPKEREHSSPYGVCAVPRYEVTALH